MQVYPARAKPIPQTAQAAPNAVRALNFGARSQFGPYPNTVSSNTPQTVPIQRQTEDGEEDDGLLAPIFGRAGGQSRQNFMREQASKAYRAGNTAPQIDFSDTLYRTVPSDPNRVAGALDHRWSDIGGGRYNDPGNRMIYGSPSARESIGEMGAYGSMADQTMVEFDYKANIDATTGRGGVADVRGNLSSLGVTESALTAHKGGSGPDFWHRLAGEDPYLHSRAVGQGAVDAGASGLRVPSATGGNQVNIIPTNTDPSQVAYRQHTPYDGAGRPTTTIVDPTKVNAMPAGGATAPGPHPVHTDPNFAANSPKATNRAGSARYGALAAGGMSAVRNFDAWMDGEMSGAEALGRTGVDAGLGGLTGVADDFLTPRLGGGLRGGLKAGGVIDAATSGLFSTWDNAGAYERGDVTAGEATANVLVDTGVGVSSGLAGAAAGAAIGSVIPVAGTAIGAGIGFLGGMAGSYLANEVFSNDTLGGWLGLEGEDGEGISISDAAKAGLGGVLNNFDDSLSGAWEGIAGAKDTISDTASGAWGAISDWWNDD